MAIPYDDGSQMPMGQAAQPPLNTASVMPPMPPGPVQSPGVGAPPPAEAGMMGGAGGFPAPGAPNEPPYDVKLQADGSGVFVSKTDPPIVIGVVPPPKLPKALQP
jgi:hypothetical protein